MRSVKHDDLTQAEDSAFLSCSLVKTAGWTVSLHLVPIFFFFFNVIRDGEEANEVPHFRTHSGMYRWNAVFKNTKGNQKKKGKARTRNLNKVVFCVFPM